MTTKKKPTPRQRSTQATSTRKAAKTATPKPKLIEGKYSHKFLTRLEPDAGELLEGLLDLTGNKTYNGAVRFIVMNYARLVKELADRQERIEVATANLAHYKRHIDAFTSALDNLKVKPGTKGGKP